MSKTTPEQNKALVLEAFDTLFNKRDYHSAERFWSERYLQHSAHIAPGRDGLFNLIRTLPATLKYENQLTVAEGGYVIVRIGWLPSTGTWSRTRRRKPNRSAACRCSVTSSPTDLLDRLGSTKELSDMTLEDTKR